MSRAIVIVGIIFLLLLDWAALDDITTGSEPNYIFEYTVLIVSAVVYGILGILFLKERASTRHLH